MHSDSFDITPVGVVLQIAELKRGAEIIVCTPGRMIDMLGANSGEFTHFEAPRAFCFYSDDVKKTQPL